MLPHRFGRASTCLFEPLHESECHRRLTHGTAGFGHAANAMLVLARQTPHLSIEERSQWERASATTRWAGEALRALSPGVNARAWRLVMRLPQPLRAVVMAMLRHANPKRGVVCTGEVYERMLFLRQDLRLRTPNDFYLRLSETLLFMDGQEDMRACIQAHQIARQLGMSHAEDMACYGCCFRLREPLFV